MTLANFNSNFNWQLRALQRAAECCTTEIGPPPLVTYCYWYVQVNDNYCNQFNSIIQNWELNGFTYGDGWFNLMTAPPYGPIGNGYQMTDPLTACGSFSYSSYYMWTMVPQTTLTLPALTGFDSYGTPVTYFMNGPICTTKCYEGTFPPYGPFGVVVYGINTAEVNNSDYSLFVDLSLPTASADLTNQLRLYYPAPLTATVLYNTLGFGEYTVRIDGVYSLGATFNLIFEDGVTIGTLNEVPC